MCFIFLIMYNTIDALNSRKYSRDFILSRIDDLGLYTRYLGDVKVNRPFCSPLRGDKNPSFNLFHSREGDIMWKDHATGESGDVFKFLRLYWQCSLSEVYKRIVDDVPSEGKKIIKRSKKIPVQENVDIGVKRKYFTEPDMLYWGKYYITKPTLYKFEVNAIMYYSINGVIGNRYSPINPLYSYKVNEKFKLYRPLTTNPFDKWKGNLNAQDVFGYKQLPKKGKLLIITKSLKDIMVLYELGYLAIAPASESTQIPDKIIQDLILRFDKIIIFFDNDEAGIRFSDKYVELYNFKNIIIDPNKNVKDISDYIELYKKTKTLKYLKSLLND